MPLERVFHVLKAPQAVVSDLGRCGTRAHQFSDGFEHRETGAQLAGQQLSLVETTLPQAGRMKRDRDDAASRKTLDHQPVREQLRKRCGKAAPAFVLETMHSLLNRSLVRHGRPKPGQRTQAGAAAAVSSRRLDLCPTPQAQRLFQPANGRPAPVAQPRADAAAASAARRQQEIEDVHTTTVWRVVKRALTATE